MDDVEGSNTALQQKQQTGRLSVFHEELIGETGN
jgi:hypothetical protein